MSFSLYPKCSINTWLSDPKIPKGATKHNVTYLREVKDIIDEISKLLCYLYFLSRYVKNYYAQSMFGSFMKQKEFFIIVKGAVKRRQITSEYVHAFELDCKKMRERLTRNRKLAYENLRLTKYWPFFELRGPEHLFDSIVIFNKEERVKAEQELFDECLKWTDEHPDEVAAHMTAVQEELDTLKRHKEQEIAKSKAEREHRKAEEKKRKDFEKERAANLHKHRMEEAAIDRSLRHLYRDANTYLAGRR